MRLEDIGFYTLSDERARTASSDTVVKRLEVLITDRCNFKCPYCRGVKPDLRGEVHLDSFRETMASLGGSVENIRFSGGEPTLNNDLSEMVGYARDNGVKRIAVSTNGSAPLEIYQDLLTAGVNDFSVSLDACCAAGFSKMSGGDERWETVSRNISFLSKETYTTVGVVLNGENEKDVEGIIQFSASLGVSDIRVIPAAQHGSALSCLKTEYEHYPILKYRATNAKIGVPVRGLSTKDFRRCPLVLDDVAIAGGKHFPCIIYLREGGEPIGEVGKSMRGERRSWFDKTNVYEDRICLGNCLDVCRDYNNKWMSYSLKQIPLEKLPESSFSWSRWRVGSENIKSLVGSWRFPDIVKNHKIIKDVAIGWAEAHALSCRPKSEEIALMFKVGDDIGWMHLRANELWEIYNV